MSAAKKYGFSSAGVGVVLSVLFFILYGSDTSGSNATAYLAAAIVCLVAGAAGLLIGVFAQ